MLRKHDGTNWVDMQFFRKHDGTNWTDVQFLRRYDGTNWVDIYPENKVKVAPSDASVITFTISDDRTTVDYNISSKYTGNSKQLWIDATGDFGNQVTISFYLENHPSDNSGTYCGVYIWIEGAIKKQFAGSKKETLTFTYNSTNITSVRIFADAYSGNSDYGKVSNLTINGKPYKFY